MATMEGELTGGEIVALKVAGGPVTKQGKIQIENISEGKGREIVRVVNRRELVVIQG